MSLVNIIYKNKKIMDFANENRFHEYFKFIKFSYGFEILVYIIIISSLYYVQILRIYCNI